MKTCTACGEQKELTEFYKRYDGHRAACKDCNKLYDQTPARKLAQAERQRLRYDNEPHKKKARNAVNNAIRDGRLIRQSCEVCGTANAEAHHEDYTKPFNVVWLCKHHHDEVHLCQA